MEQSIARALLGQEASGAPNVARKEKACCQNKFCAQSARVQRVIQALRFASVCLEMMRQQCQKPHSSHRHGGRSARNEMMECGRCGCEAAVFKLAGGARW